MTWLDQRACLDVDQAVFFPTVGGSPHLAKAICASCPVKADCLSAALENREEYGVWGGLTARERRHFQRGVRRPRIALCGTDAGYYRHVRRMREAACQPCLDAHAAAWRLRKRPALAVVR